MSAITITCQDINKFKNKPRAIMSLSTLPFMIRLFLFLNLGLKESVVVVNKLEQYKLIDQVGITMIYQYDAHFHG